VIADRARGVLLYSLAGVVLLAGGLWFVRAAPQTGPDPRVARWQRIAEEALPDLPLQTMADTIVISGDAGTERSNAVDGGSYALSMVCAGAGQVRVRLSSSGSNDSGRAVRCSEEPTPEQLRVALADEFHLSVSGERQDGHAVFRWRLERTRGF
jgi:hypothetical protein